MSYKPRPISDQVIFITGASTGVGLATVRVAVKKGAKVFMVSKDEDELQKIQDVMRMQGHETAYAVADVTEFDQLQSAADKCITTFQRIDTWINNAGVSVYENIRENKIEDSKRFFEVNFWGMSNGCKIAASLMRNEGGTIINVENTFAENGLPLHGLYSASTFAVRGFVDALRRELKNENADINLTQITLPFISSVEKEEYEAQLDQPQQLAFDYHPDLAAEVILRSAEKFVRKAKVTPPGPVSSFLTQLFPPRKLKENIDHRSQTESKYNPEVVVEGNFEGVDRKSGTGKTLSLFKGLAGLGAAALVIRKIRHI